MAPVPAARFDAIGTSVGVHATEPLVLEEAVRTAREWLERLDVAASRFRADSELVAISTRSARSPVAEVLSPRPAWTVPGDPAPVPGWRQINYTPDVRLLVMPAGTVLDFGASAKAYAADRIAALLGETLPGGFLVDLGGDIAVAGTPPEAGSQIGIGHEGALPVRRPPARELFFHALVPGSGVPHANRASIRIAYGEAVKALPPQVLIQRQAPAGEIP